MTAEDRRHRAASLLLLLGGLLLTFLCYRPGLEADFHFDDQPNLVGLSGVDDARSALEYVVSGVAGPLGRPVALASFLLHPGSWPHDPRAFLYTNVLLHLINGLLVAWLALRIGTTRNEGPVRSGYTAALAGVVWILLPILASTSLLVVQRMTSLSATFLLLGLVGYLAARTGLRRRPGAALAGMSASLVMGTLLATLTKENGALLPLFALVMEVFLLEPPRGIPGRTWRRWSAVFLWLPAAAIALILASHVPYSDAGAAMRGFGAWERLLTQAAILWEYLLNAFIPADTTRLGPFQDTHQASGSLLEPLTLAAVAGWALLIGAALRWRRRLPLLAFAVFWYLAGHLVESTVVPLDLYFEHRNYLPLVGPVFALAWCAVNVPRGHRVLASAVAAAYIGLLAVTLWLVAARWGEPLREAQEQYLAHPGSSRAVGYFGARLLALGAVDPTLLLLEKSIERGVTPERLRASRLYIQCGHFPDRDGGSDLESLRAGLPDAAFDRNLAYSLYVLARTRVSRECAALEIGDVRELLVALEANPDYRQHGESRYWLHRARAELAAGRGDRDALETHLAAAMDARFETFVLERWVDLQVEAGQPRVACRRVQALWNEAPLNPLRRLHRYLVLEPIATRLGRHMRGAGCSL